MQFQILKLVLWSKAGHAPRVVSFEPGMVEEEPSQFCACIASDTNNRGLNFLVHDSNIVLRRDSTSAALRWSGQITRTVSSPATVPTTSGHSS